MKAFSAAIWQAFTQATPDDLWPEHQSNIVTAQVGERGRTNVIVLQLMLDSAHQTIVELRFKVEGCGVAIAVLHWLKQRVQQLSIQDAQKISVVDIIETLQLPPHKRHCAIMAEEALKTALSNLS